MVRTPVTVIGGFLGAGKTTLLNHLLRHTDQRLAVLVNDFGEINIDAELIASHDGNTVNLSNGCICCSIGDSLVEALIGVMQQAERPEHIVIEASGVADPARIAELATLDASLELNAVVVLADAPRLPDLVRDKYVGDVVEQQLQSADLIIMNKIDRLSAIDRRDATEVLLRLAPDARVIEAVNASVPGELVLDAGRDLDALATAPPSPGTGSCCHGPDCNDPDHHHDHHGHDHDRRHANLFATCTLSADKPVPRAALARFLDGLPKDVLRLKGLVLTDENPSRPMLLQMVGRRWTLDADHRLDVAPKTRLVAIAVAAEFDAANLQRGFAALQ